MRDVVAMEDSEKRCAGSHGARNCYHDYSITSSAVLTLSLHLPYRICFSSENHRMLTFIEYSSSRLAAMSITARSMKTI